MRKMQPAWMRVPGTIWSIGELKSAFHKCVRRRDPRAYQVARLLWGSGGWAGRSALLRRLVTVAAEEGVFGAVPDADALLLAYRDEGTRERVALEAVLRTIGRIMATSRDKDPTYLQDWPCAVDPRWPAERSAVLLWEHWSVKRGLRLLALSREAVPAGRTRAVLAALHRRGRMGLVEGDLKIFCAIALALVEREARGEPAILPVEDPEAIPPAAELTDLPWWCFDPHVALGKQALRVLLAEGPEPPRAVSDVAAADAWRRGFTIWFRCVSDRLSGYIEREGWRGRRFAHDVLPDDVDWWNAVEPRVRASIENSLKRRTPARLGPLRVEAGAS